MNSERLSQRSRQPGHDRTFVTSENNFISVARQALDPARYRVDEKPRGLAKIFKGVDGANDLGIVPEAVIVSLSTDRQFFVEVKKQGDRGNAEERACKHHTMQFYKSLHSIFGYDYHPYVTVFCEALAVNPRYTRKAEYLFEPDQYFNWVDYDSDSIGRFLNERCTSWLD